MAVTCLDSMIISASLSCRFGPVPGVEKEYTGVEMTGTQRLSVFNEDSAPVSPGVASPPAEF